MANFLNTRIRLKYDTYQNWYTNNPTLLSGELAIVEVPNSDQMAGDSVKPQILFKVGPGAFNSLPWASAKAADVHAWAKAEKLTIEKASGQTGNVVSGISWDATNNKVTYTTASVATSEGLQDIQDRVDALESKEDKDTTYTFAQTTKGFSITPKGGSAQTITFDYLTPTEIANAYVNLTGEQTISGAKTFSRGIAVTEDVEEVDSDVTYYFNGNIIMEADGEEVHNLYIPNIAEKRDITTALSSYYTKDDTDGKYVALSGNQTISGNKTFSSSVKAPYMSISSDFEECGIVGSTGYYKNGVIFETDEEEVWISFPEKSGIFALTSDISNSLNNYYTKAEVNSKEDALSKRITANATAIEALTNGTSTEEIDSVMELVDYVNEHGTEVQGMKDDIKANADAIDVIEAKPAMGITATNITNWGTAYTNTHTHGNKALLDTYTQTEANLADAVTKKHSHSNKDYLDSITSTRLSNWDNAYTNSHTHSNKALLDTYTQTEANLADAVSKKHSHANKAALDEITSDNVYEWNEVTDLVNREYGIVKNIDIWDDGAKHEYGLGIYKENIEEGTDNFIKLDDIKLNTGSHLGKTLGTLVSDVETLQGKKHVEYYEATAEDYSKGSIIICCGSSSKLV